MERLWTHPEILSDTGVLEVDALLLDIRLCFPIPGFEKLIPKPVFQ